MRSLASGTSHFLKTMFYMVNLKMYFFEKLSCVLFPLLSILTVHLTSVSAPALTYCRRIGPLGDGGHGLPAAGAAEKVAHKARAGGGSMEAA